MSCQNVSSRHEQSRMLGPLSTVISSMAVPARSRSVLGEFGRRNCKNTLIARHKAFREASSWNVWILVINSSTVCRSHFILVWYVSISPMPPCSWQMFCKILTISSTALLSESVNSRFEMPLGGMIFGESRFWWLDNTILLIVVLWEYS